MYARAVSVIKLVANFVRSISAFNYRLGNIVRWGFFALMAVMLIEIIARYGFNAPQPWSHEISIYIFLGFFLLAGGYILLTEEHIRMDVLYSRWSVRKRAIADAITFPLVVIWLGALIWKGSVFATRAVITGERYWSLVATPLGPIKVIMVGGCVILFLQALAFFIRDLSIIFRGKDLA